MVRQLLDSSRRQSSNCQKAHTLCNLTVLNNFSVFLSGFRHSVGKEFSRNHQIVIFICFIHYKAFETESLVFPQIAKFVKIASTLETAYMNIVVMDIAMILITKLPVNGMAVIAAISLTLLLI